MNVDMISVMMVATQVEVESRWFVQRRLEGTFLVGIEVALHALVDGRQCITDASSIIAFT
jgi:hypothetical protein